MQLNIVVIDPNEIEQIQTTGVASQDLRNLIIETANSLDADRPAAIIKLGKIWNVEFIKNLPIMFAEFIGIPIAQNSNGDVNVSVYERDRNLNMYNGDRYHQTRQGGIIHTDNVNSPANLNWLILACLQPSIVGGESIFVSGKELHNILKTRYPDVLATLEQEDWQWDMRGVSDDMYTAPVVTYDKNNNPIFRYLRPYMEGAHQKSGIPLSDEKVYAMDVLDSLTESSELQTLYLLERGDIMLALDNHLLHGRRTFSDPLNAVDINNDYSLAPLKRTMQRIWVTEKET